MEEREAEQGWPMLQPGATCSQGLEQQQINGYTYCGMFTNGSGCLSAGINKIVTSYSQVCGRVAGYQYNSPKAFTPYYLLLNKGIDQAYFEGLSIMYGSPRRHIMLLDIHNIIMLIYFHVHVIMEVLISHLLLLAVTTTVNLEILLTCAILYSTPMTPCEMDSSVVVVRLPAAHTPKCHGSSRHSMRPPLRTLNMTTTEDI